jgi:hypothetical protein
MTPDWFRDLAERCRDAARFASDIDEPSPARDFSLARQDAEDLAYFLEREIAEVTASHDATDRVA